MNLELDEVVVQQAVASAVLDQLGAEGQRTLVAAALQYLVSPAPPTSFNRNPQSPLQDAFNRAVGSAAAKIVTELVANDEEFKRSITEKVGEAFLQMESTDFSDYLGSALSEALKSR